MTIVVSNNVTNVQVSDSAAARADRLLAEAAAAQATGVVPTTTGLLRLTSINYLRTTTPDTAKNALLSGYYADGDGGGGLFYAKTSGGPYTDNGGTIITPGGGTSSTAWVRAYSGELNVKWFGAKTAASYDASTATINVTAFQNARTVAHSVGTGLYAPGGTYYFNDCLTSSENLIIRGDGYDTVLDFSAISVGNYALEALGSSAQIQDINTVSQGTRTITFANTPSLSQNDIFVIYNPTNGSFNNARTYYRGGEFCEVVGVSGSTVYIRTPLYDAYTTGNVSIYKVSGPKVHLRDFAVKGTSITGLIHADLCKHLTVENLRLETSGNSCLYFSRSYDAIINGLIATNHGSSGDDYGLSIRNSQNVQISGGFIQSRRHGITFGGSDQIISVPTRNVRVTNATIATDVRSGINAADIHGDNEDVQYINCTIYGGAQFGGRNNYYINCEITNAPGGVCVLFTEVKGQKFGIINCKLITNADPSASNRAIVYAGTQDGSLGTFTTEDLTIIVQDCTLRGQNLSSSTVFARMGISGCIINTNFVVDGLTADVNAMGGVLYTGVGSGTPSAQFFIVDRISGVPNGAYLHSSGSSTYANAPQRMQKQTGRQSLTASSGSYYTTGSTVTFRYTYPRTPSAQVTSGGNSALLFNGNRPALALADQVDSTQIIPAIVSPDATNWSSTATVDVNWSVCIDDV